MKTLLTFGQFGWGNSAIQAFNQSPATKAIKSSGICSKETKVSKRGFKFQEFLVPENREDLVSEIYQGFKSLEKPKQNPKPYQFTKYELGEDQKTVVNSVINDCFNGQKSFIIQAAAGSGKTYTCFEYILQEYSKKPGAKQTILGLCFGRANADELQRKCPPVNGWDFRNFHSLAYGALARFLGKKLIIDEFKVINKINKLPSIQTLNGEGKKEQLIAAITSKAMNRAISLVLNCLIDFNDPKQLSDLLDHYWNQLASPREKGFIDYEILMNSIPDIIEQCVNDKNSFTFDEMLYLCILWDLPFQKYDIVMIDEVQDTNKARIEIAKKCLKNSGRLVAVGDQNQNIMVFTGCDYQSMKKVKDEFSCEELNLNTSRRNPGIITSFVSKTFGININCLKGRENSGNVSSIQINEMNEKIEPGDMVLCRKRSECVDVAISLLNAGRLPIIVGDDSLISKIISTALQADPDSPQVAIEKLQEKDDEEENGDDINKTIIKLLENSVSMVDFVRKVFSLLGEDTPDKIRIMTGHKSKGLEANNVYCIQKEESFGMFFPGQKDHESAAEKNLEYVAYTRSLENLYMVNL